MQAGQLVVLVKHTHELALHDRVIAAMSHVLLARPQSFTGVPGICFAMLTT